MDAYLQANQKLWDQWTIEHERSPFYDLEGFRSGKDRLRSIELEELGDVSGKSLLHLQCHFGMDTLAWARRGAIATGVDFSPRSVALARSLSAELGIPARFECADIYALPNVLDDQFDIVFTSYGVLHWLRDLPRWAEIIAHYVKPGGIFYIVEDHPVMRTFDSDLDKTRLVVGNSYFFSETPDTVKSEGSYATGFQSDSATFYIWNHSLSELINSLIGAGLQIDFLHEFPCAARQKFPMMVRGDDGWWRMPPGHPAFPFLFSLRAQRARHAK